jgi:hypothetical protein
LQGQRVSIDNFMGHLDHLAGGLRYVRGCIVCGLTWSVKQGFAGAEFREDVEFYNAAAASGKRTIEF